MSGERECGFEFGRGLESLGIFIYSPMLRAGRRDGGECEHVI